NANSCMFSRLLALQIYLLADVWAARAVLILANFLIGYPYMFLVATGALQAIPRELGQAAQLDGAGPWQAFRHVTLPLLMVAMAPILIATFAFNFNNFNAIWLITRGGPFGAEGTAAGGGTDLLITYTYRLAFSEATSHYGYAAALSVMIFLIVSL